MTRARVEYYPSIRIHGYTSHPHPRPLPGPPRVAGASRCACDCSSCSPSGSCRCRSSPTSCRCRSRRVSRHLKLLADQGWIVSPQRAHREPLPHGERRAAGRRRAGSGSSPREEIARLVGARARPAAARAPARRARADGDAPRLLRRRRRRVGAAARPSSTASASPTAALRALLPARLDGRRPRLRQRRGGARASRPRWRASIAVDHSREMLAAAQRRLAGAKNVELRRGELEALPIDDGACDAALLLLALTHVEEPARALARDGAHPAPGRPRRGRRPAAPRPRRLPPPDGSAPQRLRDRASSPRLLAGAGLDDVSLCAARRPSPTPRVRRSCSRPVRHRDTRSAHRVRLPSTKHSERKRR